MADYWDSLRALVAESRIVVDRKRNTAHPQYPDMVYPVDYGYLEGTRSMDGAGIDIFVGTAANDRIQGILCVIDTLKKDSEIKVLYQCTEAEIETITRFMNDSEYMKALFVKARGESDMKPTLYIFSGLPGAGKTTIAKALAGRFKAAYFRLDTVEHGLRELCAVKVEGEGYGLTGRMAADNLALGNDVVVDCCNPWELTRTEWEAVAARSGALHRNIEIFCSDRAEHRRRAESRDNDIAGFTLPSWEEIERRDYRAWPAGAAIRIDTAGRDAAASVEELLSRLGKR